MAFTGKLGSSDSQLGQLVLANMGEPPSFARSVFDALSLAQSLSLNMAGQVADPLILVDQAVAVVVRVGSASSALALAQAVMVGEELPRSISHTLALSPSTTESLEVPRAAASALALVQGVESNIKMASASQALGLSQGVERQGPIYEQVKHNLNLAQPSGGHLGDVSQSALHTLLLVQKAGRTVSALVSQSLALVQSATRFTGAHHVLALTQTVTFGKGPKATHTLALVDVGNRQALLGRAIVGALAFKQAVTFERSTACHLKQYAPFVGHTDDEAFPPPPTTGPILSASTLTLTHPYLAPTTTVVLRNPPFGDRDALSFTRVSRETLGGTLVVFADPKWPSQQTLTVQVASLSASQLADLASFFDVSLGQEVGLLDHEGRQWRGYIVKPETEFSQPGRHDRSVTFDFEGELA